MNSPQTIVPYTHMPQPSNSMINSPGSLHQVQTKFGPIQYRTSTYFNYNVFDDSVHVGPATYLKIGITNDFSQFNEWNFDNHFTANVSFFFPVVNQPVNLVPTTPVVSTTTTKTVTKTKKRKSETSTTKKKDTPTKKTKSTKDKLEKSLKELVKEYKKGSNDDKLAELRKLFEKEAKAKVKKDAKAKEKKKESKPKEKKESKPKYKNLDVEDIKVKDDSDPTLVCVICQENERKLMYGCQHYCCCVGCTKILIKKANGAKFKCPICQKPVQSTITVFKC